MKQFFLLAVLLFTATAIIAPTTSLAQSDSFTIYMTVDADPKGPLTASKNGNSWSVSAVLDDGSAVTVTFSNEDGTELSRADAIAAVANTTVTTTLVGCTSVTLKTGVEGECSKSIAPPKGERDT